MTLTNEKGGVPRPEETDSDRRRGILAPDVLSLDLVSAFAGDRPLKEGESTRLDGLKKKRGRRFFSDLLYSITHQYFPLEAAEELWNEVLGHKLEVSKALGRNVKIAVAALDYLSNITENMGSATLIGEEHIGEIVALSLRDGLTGLFNHTYFYQQVVFEVRRYVRYGTSLSLVLIDIDDFKTVNDRYGHREGDRILAGMGGTLLREARDSDICCRYGGEEFAVILPLTELHQAGDIATRLRREMRSDLPDGGRVTLSLGVASCGENTKTHFDLVERADAALYRAKKSGKDRVVVAANGAGAKSGEDSAKGGLLASRPEERPLPDAEPW
jgi:diguanylate cyclase (GGDEF)-like protein